MKCVQCGEELKEGSLFCSRCGKEVQIVPDYNEYDEDYLKAVLAEANRPKPAIKKPQTERKQKGKNRRRMTQIYAMIAVFAVITGTVSILLIRAGVKKKQDNSFAYQFETAKKAYESGDLDQAVLCYENALSLDRDNLEVRLILADIYMERKDYDSALILCQEVIQKDRANRQALETLIAIYESRKKYEPILALQEVVDESLRDLFAPYLVAPPAFTVSPDTYDTFMTLEITAEKDSSIYYTVDGSDPVAGGKRYAAPIELDQNQKTYRVQAVCRNGKGLYSEVISGEFRIDIPAPDMPIVTPDGGDFGVEITIAVSVPDGCSAYYTWDGSDPSSASRTYTGPITIPEGNNVLSVIIIDDTTGLCSDIYRGNFIFYREEDDEGEVLPELPVSGEAKIMG